MRKNKNEVKHSQKKTNGKNVDALRIEEEEISRSLPLMENEEDSATNPSQNQVEACAETVIVQEPEPEKKNVDSVGKVDTEETLATEEEPSSFDVDVTSEITFAPVFRSFGFSVVKTCDLEAGINRISRLEKEIVELRRAIATAQQENSALRQTVTKKEEQIIAAKEEKKAQLSDDVERLKQSHLKLIELLQRREEEHAETQATGQQTHEGIQRITKELGECRDLLYDCRMSFKKYEKEVKEETARMVGEAVKHEDIERIVNDTVKTVVYSFVDEIIRPAQGNMDELRQEQHKICQTLYEMSHEREEFKSNTVALQQERAELLRNAEALQQERAEMQRNTEALQQERAKLQRNTEALRQERTELNDQAEALQREKEVLQSETEILCRDREALCQNEQHFEAQKKQKEEELRGKEEEIGRMQAEITMEKETLTEERARIDHDRAEAQAVAADIEQARKQFDYYEKLFEGVQGDMGLDDQLTYRANLSRFERAYNDMELVLMYCNNAHEKKYVESLRDILAEIEGVAKRHTK